MPIEIKELHIKVSVTNPQSGKASTSTSTVSHSELNPLNNDKEEMVATCVEKVLEIILNKTER